MSGIVCVNCYIKEDVERLLEEYKPIGKQKDVGTLLLRLPDSRYLREVLSIFPNTRSLDLKIFDYTGDMKGIVILSELRKVHFNKVIPTEMKNFWKLFSNLEHITIGNRDYPTVFTSEFVNKVIQRNGDTLKVLKLQNIPLVKATFSDLRIPCQLKELEVAFFKNSSKEEVCNVEYNAKKISKPNPKNPSGRIFCTNEEDLTTFTDLKDILKSQKELEHLHLVDAVIDSSTLDRISRITTLKSLKLVKSDLTFDEISEVGKEFISKIKSLYISHIPQSSVPGFRLILENLKEVETLEINVIWPEVILEPLESRNLLPNLKVLTMHINHKSEVILDSFQLTGNLVNLTANITSIKTVKEILKTCSYIKKIVLHNGENKVANFVARRFKNLEEFELITEYLSIETILHIVSSASNIKRAKIESQTHLNGALEDKIDERLGKRFPTFSSSWGLIPFSDDMEVGINNEDLDFKLELKYRPYNADEKFL